MWTGNSVEHVDVTTIHPQEQYVQDKLYVAKGAAVGTLVEHKQELYGDSFSTTVAVLTAYFPDGIAVENYEDALFIMHDAEKVKRHLTANDRDGENPLDDRIGYSIIWGVRSDRRRAADKVE